MFGRIFCILLRLLSLLVFLSKNSGQGRWFTDDRFLLLYQFCLSLGSGIVLGKNFGNRIRASDEVIVVFVVEMIFHLVRSVELFVTYLTDEHLLTGPALAEGLDLAELFRDLQTVGGDHELPPNHGHTFLLKQLVGLVLGLLVQRGVGGVGGSLGSLLLLLPLALGLRGLHLLLALREENSGRDVFQFLALPGCRDGLGFSLFLLLGSEDCSNHADLLLRLLTSLLRSFVIRRIVV